GDVVVWLLTYIELVIEETSGICAVVWTAQLGSDIRDHGVLDEDVADLRREFAGRVEGDGVRHGRANPQCSLIEVGHKLAADEWNHEERREEDDCGTDHRGPGVIQAPLKQN